MILSVSSKILLTKIVLIQPEIMKSFEITIEGSIADFLGVEFTRRSDGCIELTKPHLIEFHSQRPWFY